MGRLPRARSGRSAWRPPYRKGTTRSRGAVDRDTRTVGEPSDCVQVAIELADAHDAAEVRRLVVVVEDKVATGRVVADVSGGGIVAFGRAVGHERPRQRRGLLDAVVISDGERQRELAGEFARGRVVVQPRAETGVAEHDEDWRAGLAAGVLCGRGAGVRRRRRGVRLRSAGGLVTVLARAAAG